MQLAGSHSVLLGVANVAAVLALMAMMFGVGLALGPHVERLPRSLSRRTAWGQVLANTLMIPLLAAGVVAVSDLPRAVGIAVVLLACFPAGPISLLFVSQRQEHLVRASAIVLLLQLVSLVSAPLLLLGLGMSLFGEGLFGDPGRAGLTISIQVLGLELLPIFVGTFMSRRLEATRRARLLCRRVAMALLLVAAAAFSRAFYDALQGLWAPALMAGLLLVLTSWSVASLGRGKLWRHDSAQIAGIRNMSLALVVAGSRPELADSLLAVLIMSGVISAAAPVLRLVAGPVASISPPEEASSLGR